MKILVTGGAGYIGTALIPQLLAAGHRVRLLDCFLYGDDTIAQFRRDIDIITADFRNIKALSRAMQGVDVVVHLAALVGDPACALDADTTLSINHLGAVDVAETARVCGVKRVVFSSTCSVYGAGHFFLSEASPLNPVSLYAESKIFAERDILSFHSHSLQVIIARFGTVYGLSGRLRFDLVVNLLAAKAFFDREITVFGGEQWRPFLHVQDAARALMLMTETPVEKTGRIYNVGANNENYKIIDLGWLIHHEYQRAALKQAASQIDLRDYRVNFDRITNDLGFCPQWTVLGGIRQILSACMRGRITDYTQSEHNNVKHLRDVGVIKWLQPAQEAINAAM